MERVDDPEFVFAEMLDSAVVRGAGSVKFTDQYGDTTFNQMQLSPLLAELESLRLVATHAQVVSHLEAIIDLARRARGA